jgi:hypothetical protein
MPPTTTRSKAGAKPAVNNAAKGVGDDLTKLRAETEPDADLSRFSAATKDSRDAAKWLLAGFGAIAVALAAGTQLSSIGSLSDPIRIAIAVAAAAVGLTAAAVAAALTIWLLLPGYVWPGGSRSAIAESAAGPRRNRSAIGSLLESTEGARPFSRMSTPASPAGTFRLGANGIGEHLGGQQPSFNVPNRRRSGGHARSIGGDHTFGTPSSSACVRCHRRSDSAECRIGRRLRGQVRWPLLALRGRR